MALPAFTSDKLLPPGIHPATLGEVAERLVADFPDASSRRGIFEGLERYQHRIADLGLNVTQWIDGSFVDQTRLSPGDVDIVNFIHAQEYESACDRIGETMIEGLLDGIEGTKTDYQVHSFLVQVFPKEQDRYFRFFLRARDNWIDWWSTPQKYDPVKEPDLTRPPKGFVEMRVGVPDRCPTLFFQ